MSIKNILSSGVCLNDRYIPDYEKLVETLNHLRAIGNQIVMTQGVYDLIHPGHTRYLELAKKMGDILVVAVDTDEYTRRRKQRANERRPAVPFEERLELLANMRSVDVLTRRDVDKHIEDPDFVIKVVCPDVLVMSKSTSDISSAKLEEIKQLCGRLEVLDPQATTSTTARLRELVTDGAAGLVDHLAKAIDDYFNQSGRTVVFGQKKTNGGGNE